MGRLLTKSLLVRPSNHSIGSAEVELTSADLKEIEAAMAKIDVHGGRYPEKLEQMTGL